MMRRLPLFIILPLLASCVAPSGPVAPTPAPRPAPRPAPVAPAAPAVVDRYAGDWSVADLPPGEWRYSSDGRSSIARFTAGNGPVQASISCTGGQVTLARSGIIPADMAVMFNIRTSFAERQLPIHVDVSGRMLTTTLPGRDPLWDQIIYSRGRFLIEATRQAPLLVPTRSDIARVVEDCRR